MIERQQVIDLTNEWLADKEYFLVDVVISKDDKITVEIDHAEGVCPQEFSSTTVQKHLQCSAFFMVQLSHLYITTTKTIALTRRTFVGKVISLLLNLLSRLVIAFLPRSKCHLIS